MSDLTKPQSRVEKILANMTGYSKDNPSSAQSRVEEYLLELMVLLEGGGISDEEMSEIISEKVDAYIQEHGLDLEFEVDSNGYLHI